MANITAWVKKVWKDRKTEYPTRRTLTKTNGSQEIVTVARNEGNVSQEGDAFSAANMNDLEERIDAGFTELTGKLQWKSIATSTPVNQWVWHDFSQYNDILVTVEKSNGDYEFCMFSANQLIAEQRTFIVGSNKIYAKNNAIALTNVGDGIGMAILVR